VYTFLRIRKHRRAMAILAMPEHGQDARGTKSSRGNNVSAIVLDDQ
jgi:hypothetical protein